MGVHKKHYRAGEIEGTVWEAASGVMKDPEQLRVDLEEMVQRKRGSMRGDPETEAETWLRKLSKADSKRSGFQDLAAEGLITFDELLAELEETRKTVETELDTLKPRKRLFEELERDKNAVLETYARMAPEALDALAPDERHQFYKMLRLRVTAYPDSSLEVSGVFGEGVDGCKLKPTL
jgi:hypothetical protein